MILPHILTLLLKPADIAEDFGASWAQDMQAASAFLSAFMYKKLLGHATLHRSSPCFFMSDVKPEKAIGVTARSSRFCFGMGLNECIGWLVVVGL